MGPILSVLGTLPALTRPRAILVGSFLTKFWAISTLPFGRRFPGRELASAAERRKSAREKQRMPGKMILAEKDFGRLHLSSLFAVVAGRAQEVVAGAHRDTRYPVLEGCLATEAL